VNRAGRVLDEYLVISAQAGDQKAAALLVKRWHKKLVAHAWRITGDSEMARDAAQVGWSEILTGIDKLHDARAFPAWAYRIVSRACFREVRGAVRRRSLADALDGEPAAAAMDPDAGVDATRLRTAIRQLPPAHRAAVALFHFEDLSVAEVAVALDVSAGTVKTRLMHARRKLRAAFQGDE
jgi:RNA polymerase sigma-70 factor (ECF subfamily)